MHSHLHGGLRVELIAREKANWWKECWRHFPLIYLHCRFVQHIT